LNGEDFLDSYCMPQFLRTSKINHTRHIHNLLHDSLGYFVKKRLKMERLL